jgi:RNA polymerase sigma-70 factor (ECF subfamily)
MTPLHLRTDLELLRAADDPVEAFSVFYRRHVDGLLRFVASRDVPAEAAADVVADTFLVALRRRHAFVDHADGARLWLIGIAVNKLGDQRRRGDRDRRRLEQLQVHAELLTPQDLESYAHVLRQQDGGTVGLLDDLPEAQRQAIRQRVIEGREYPEIAGALGLSEPATRQHVSRGLARLRTQLGRNR